MWYLVIDCKFTVRYCAEKHKRQLKRWGLVRFLINILISSFFSSFLFQAWFNELPFCSFATLSTPPECFLSLLQRCFVGCYHMINICWDDRIVITFTLSITRLTFPFSCLVCSQISQMLGNELKFAVREPIGLRWDFSCSLAVNADDSVRSSVHHLNIQ